METGSLYRQRPTDPLDCNGVRWVSVVLTEKIVPHVALFFSIKMMELPNVGTPDSNVDLALVAQYCNECGHFFFLIYDYLLLLSM